MSWSGCVAMLDDIATHLKSLDWLPVKVGSAYKIACLCHNCHSSTTPSYTTDIPQKKPSHTRSSSYTMPLVKMTLEAARLPALHSSVSVANGMSHHE